MLKLIFSCEHGGNFIPDEYQSLFALAEEVLKTHKGWDIGILEVAKDVSQALNIDLSFSEVSRLLVELNRSIDTPDLFSLYTKRVKDEEKRHILKEYYYPYRNEVEGKIKNHILNGDQVIHISFHSFTPILNGEERTTDLGLLYDPERKMESLFCAQWKGNLDQLNSFITKLNYPYLGTDDGFTTYLRTKFSDPEYAGIELEVNQKYLTEKENVTQVNKLLITSLQQVLTDSRQ